jgi:protein-S-isoprenylcysteine O-methyltransferase Ste14
LAPHFVWNLKGSRFEGKMVIRDGEERDGANGAWGKVVSDGFVQRGGLWVMGQSVLMGAVAIGGVLWRGDWHSSLIFFSGVILLCVSAGCGIAGSRALGRNLTPFPKPSAGGGLVQTGIYGLMRHPLYTAVFCAAMGWALVWQSCISLLAAVVLGLFFNVKARREEIWLRKQYPDYAQYEQRVRRFIPWIF